MQLCGRMHDRPSALSQHRHLKSQLQELQDPMPCQFSVSFPSVFRQFSVSFPVPVRYNPFVRNACYTTSLYIHSLIIRTGGHLRLIVQRLVSIWDLDCRGYALCRRWVQHGCNMGATWVQHGHEMRVTPCSDNVSNIALYCFV